MLICNSSEEQALYFLKQKVTRSLPLRARRLRARSVLGGFARVACALRRTTVEIRHVGRLSLLALCRRVVRVSLEAPPTVPTALFEVLLLSSFSSGEACFLHHVRDPTIDQLFSSQAAAGRHATNRALAPTVGSIACGRRARGLGPARGCGLHCGLSCVVLHVLRPRSAA